ncbi:FKBP-type peptidyl-prolyl cis-trans isomerase [Pontibacter sp. SGAir0037]|uniref:FKBP-type peptidyl-prolyl cis-trans isomerase n=1 Tax=Pontibacter sp. SGAir0037 TaxID=2571030 RepID=UPI0010CD6426|nr:FKBP-type peptidyl-prolyl cis-trans isomerase [Pontibacter sp. SGAir0037]QCR23660.1 peptidylprolyl isomerase [Pontibacter sp. SGAir0037]
MSLKLFIQRAFTAKPWLKVLLPLLVISLFTACKEPTYNPYAGYIPTAEEIEQQKVKDDQIIQKYFDDNQTGEYAVNKDAVVKTSSGLYYLKEEEGTGPAITSGSTVDVHYIGRFTNNVKFDSSYDRAQTFPVTIDKTGVIKGWHEALKLMKGGERARFFIPSYLGYSYNGNGSIPPNTVLVFDIKVERVR